MDWSKTKSIFIIVFFVLDIFLLYQFLEKKDNYQFEYFAEATIEDQLQGDEITYDSLPKQNLREQFLTAQSKIFKMEDIVDLPNQKVKVVDQTKLSGSFDKPISISKNFQSSELEKLVKDHMLYGSEYRYWDYDETEREIIFYQTWDKKMFFNNSKGKITLFLDKENQVISYEQTYLENIKKVNEEKDLVTAFKALEALYENDYIEPKSEVTKVDLGYYNSLQTTSATHLLVPVWRVVINNELDLFVNAFDGGIIELNTEEKRYWSEWFMTMHFSVLASGSTGNAFFVETEDHAFLVDAGLSGKAMAGLFSEIGRDMSKLTGILVTHEHSDHIKGIGVVARKYKLPIYANAKTWSAMEHAIGEIPTEQKFIFEMEQVKTFGSLDIESFGVSHDAAEPMFYVFHHEGKKIALITDTGYVSERMKGIISNADVYVFESNHDVSMLRMGRYPWSVKRRILSDVGHVSNEDAALAMYDVAGDQTKRIYLAHLSMDNNMKDLARMSVEQTLKSKGILVGEQFSLYDTDPKKPTELVTI